MQTPIFLSVIQEAGNAHSHQKHTDWWDLRCPPSVALLEKSDSCLHREIITSLHICERDAGSYFSLLWDFMSKATSWPSSYIQVKGYYWHSGREEAYVSSVLCMLFDMVIMPLLSMYPAPWFRVTPIVRFVNAFYLMTRWEWIFFLLQNLHSVLFWELNRV